VLANDEGIDICVGGVGSGKSKVAAAKVLRWVARHPRSQSGRPAQGLILGKDFRNASGNQFADLRAMARTLIGVPEDKVIVGELGMPAPTITFWNGVTAQAFTGTNPETTRSYEADWLWADEAECMDAISLVTALGRLRASKIRAIVTSNPSGGGWLWPMLSGDSKEWDAIREANEVRVYRWPSKINRYLDEKTLGTLRAAYNAVSPGLARQELGGRFLGTREAPAAGLIDFSKAFAAAHQVASPTAAVVSADLGRAKDYCWFTALSAEGVVLAMERFNEHEVEIADPKEYWPLARRRLVEFIVRWGALIVVVDGARGGDQFAAALREELEKLGLALVHVIDFPTDAPGKKSDAISAAAMAAQLGRLHVPLAWSAPGGGAGLNGLAEALRLETVKLQVEQLPGGRLKITHAPGGHDDGVVSVSLAWHGLQDLPATGSASELAGFAPSLGRPADLDDGSARGFGLPPRRGGGYVF
jgi:hypothetical protein